MDPSTLPVPDLAFFVGHVLVQHDAG